MASVTYLGAMCTGHPSGFPPRPNVQGSTNVFVNGIPVHRVGDSWASHTQTHKPYSVCSGAVLASGSTTVFVNGKPCGRVADPVSCGSLVAQGSPNVFAGG